MAKPKKTIKEVVSNIIHPEVKVEPKVKEVVTPKFDPTIPESKQRHLR